MLLCFIRNHNRDNRSKHTNIKKMGNRKIKLELLQEHGTKMSGEVIELSPETAAAFIRCGVAKKADQNTIENKAEAAAPENKSDGEPAERKRRTRKN